MSAQPTCGHLDQVREVQPGTPEGCEDCLATGGRWVHLRLCQTCGHVGCCDSSPNRHASKHAAAHEHALASSFEPGEDWTWCYVDEVAFVLEGIEHPHRRPYPGER
jgi:Zn-finger in ubiquitin-hydrolases and other protein